jgi:hypothetical protein
MDLQQIAPALWRWTAPHPDWQPASGEDDVNNWERDVGCVLFESRDATVLIDPLVPDDGWDALDRHVRERGLPVVLLITVKWHRRSADEVLARWDAREPQEGDALPAGVERQPIEGAGEAMYWLPEQRALVPGDRLIGKNDGGTQTLRMNPDSWMDDLEPPLKQAGLAARLRPLLDLPIERVLVSHGVPVLDDGLATVRAAIDAGAAD